MVVKMILVDFLIGFPMYAVYMWYERDTGLVFLSSFTFNTVAVMQLVATTNIVQFALIWGNCLYRLINERIQHLVSSIRQMDDSVEYWNGSNAEQRYIFRHIWRHLNILRGQHYTLTESIRDMARFYNLPLALIMSNQFVIIISEVSKHR
ncbi:AGAP001169-PA-like protein [Anopheles sinensis]|uniref:AGAP001169-PA-like protein n=1 Tax=Anopheles sinensis TaxID=74873 RepID=A0A084W0H4_ANOSI|nr:AGAP001169-PA-like protein [Anopheles sinensis]